MGNDALLSSMLFPLVKDITPLLHSWVSLSCLFLLDTSFIPCDVYCACYALIDIQQGIVFSVLLSRPFRLKSVLMLERSPLGCKPPPPQKKNPSTDNSPQIHKNKSNKLVLKNFKVESINMRFKMSIIRNVYSSKCRHQKHLLKYSNKVFVLAHTCVSPAVWHGMQPIIKWTSCVLFIYIFQLYTDSVMMHIH